jgi:hypothetical protein
MAAPRGLSGNWDELPATLYANSQPAYRPKLLSSLAGSERPRRGSGIAPERPSEGALTLVSERVGDPHDRQPRMAQQILDPLHAVEAGIFERRRAEGLGEQPQEVNLR